MKLPASIAQAAARFDRLSLRERILAAGATLVALIMAWIVMFLDPLTAKERALTAELTSLQEAIGTAAKSMQAAAKSDSTAAALLKEADLKQQLQQLDAQLASQSAGLIPPERMVQVIQDLLSRQHGVTLISLHNQPVTTLTAAAQPAAEPSDAGPYVHPVELVIEGRYLDLLAYLHRLESLQWRFYWRLLELKTTAYPLNHVRIELSTLSLDQDWLGV